MIENSIIVTIRCAVYNHEPFIRQCLDGFVMQKTNFRFEAIVHDDASSDKSAEIIREYAAKYPDIIKPIFETENQYSKHDGSLIRIMNAHTRGKYIALCEGDDYWIDPYKLQKQVDFLESHPIYSICGHWVQSYNENNHSFADFFVDDIDTYDLTYFANGGHWCPTLSVVYRRSALDLSVYNQYKNSIDITLFFHLLKSGLAYCIHEKMAVYRIHQGGIWSGTPSDIRVRIDFLVRLGIYNVEHSYEAATFLKQIFTYDFGRRWMLKNVGLLFKVALVLKRHFGLAYVSKLYYRYIFNRSLPIPM